MLTHAVVRAFPSLGAPDFRFLTISSVAGSLGMWMQSIGTGWLVLELTGSAVQLGVFSFIRGGTTLLASLPAGVLADRWSRRQIIIVTTLLGVMWALTLGLLLVTETVQLWHIYVITALDAITGSANFTARQAMVYDTAEPATLPNAVAVGSLAFNLARITGPSLAGILIGSLGLAACFLAQALAWVLSAVFTMFIRTPGAAAAGRISPWTDLRDGLGYSLRAPLIFGLLMAAVLPTVLVYPYVSYLPLFANDILKVGAEGYGILSSGLGFGSIAGALLLAWLKDVPHKGWIMLATLCGYIVLIIAFALSSWFPLSMACLIVSGLFHSIYSTLNTTLTQLATRTEFRGRVMALMGMTFGLTPFGALPMGFLIAEVGAPLSVAAFCAAACISVLALVALSPALRKA